MGNERIKIEEPALLIEAAKTAAVGKSRHDIALAAVRHLENLFATNLQILADLEAQTAGDRNHDSRLWHRRNLAAALVDYYKDELEDARLALYAAKMKRGEAKKWS